MASGRLLAFRKRNPWPTGTHLFAAGFPESIQLISYWAELRPQIYIQFSCNKDRAAPVIKESESRTWELQLQAWEPHLLSLCIAHRAWPNPDMFAGVSTKNRACETRQESDLELYGDHSLLPSSISTLLVSVMSRF